MMNEEVRNVELTLNGETRTVSIARISPQHCWYGQCMVLVKCRTGTKLHRSYRPQVIERNGRWGWAHTRIHNHSAIPVAWADNHPGSGWN